MSGHGELGKTLHPRVGKSFFITLQCRLERLRGFPFRMLGRQRLDAVHDKGTELKIERLFRPQSSVIVERGNTFLRRNIVRPRFVGYLFHKVDDALLCRAVIPGGQGIFRQRRIRRQH